MEGGKKQTNLTNLKVHISDKLEKVIDLATDGCFGAVLTDGKPLNEFDISVEKADLHEG